ncbi:hypothetical protein [Actinacidiphila sp. bgisy144]|uniref:hypothetical protein n=1 Tax=Actinacidiphila sp. bgisy144 TaxID=3413791 RepID=UPI003EBABD23
MTLALRTNNHPSDARTAPAATPAGGDPLLQLQYEPEPHSGPRAIHYIRHPQELTLRGIPVMCAFCRDRRDWLVMNEGRNVFIQCRCNNRCHEPEITRADFLALTRLPDTTTYASMKESVAAMGWELRGL